MKLRAFENTWHNVNLSILPGGGDSGPAGPELYRKFYGTLNCCGKNGSPDWIRRKTAIGQFVAERIFAEWERHHGRPPRVLALCVGKCVAEGVWLDQGYAVTVHECQLDSLSEIRNRYPRAPVVICDIRELEFDQEFDIVTLIASEYFLSRSELSQFMRTAASGLSPGGLLIIQSVSILSMRQAVKELVKRLIGHYHKRPYVFWGYWRTPSEFATTAKSTGLRAVSRYVPRWKADGRIATCHRRRVTSMPPISINAEVMVFEKP